MSVQSAVSPSISALDQYVEAAPAGAQPAASPSEESWDMLRAYNVRDALDEAPAFRDRSGVDKAVMSFAYVSLAIIGCYSARLMCGPSPSKNERIAFEATSCSVTCLLLAGMFWGYFSNNKENELKRKKCTAALENIPGYKIVDETVLSVVLQSGSKTAQRKLLDGMHILQLKAVFPLIQDPELKNRVRLLCDRGASTAITIEDRIGVEQDLFDATFRSISESPRPDLRGLNAVFRDDKKLHRALSSFLATKIMEGMPETAFLNIQNFAAQVKSDFLLDRCSTFVVPIAEQGTVNAVSASLLDPNTSSGEGIKSKTD